MSIAAQYPKTIWCGAASARVQDELPIRCLDLEMIPALLITYGPNPNGARLPGVSRAGSAVLNEVKQRLAAHDGNHYALSNSLGRAIWSVVSGKVIHPHAGAALNLRGFTTNRAMLY